MKENYSIDEILSAVNDIQKTRKEKNNLSSKISASKSDDPNIPKNTLKLIEEAEKSKN